MMFPYVIECDFLENPFIHDCIHQKYGWVSNWGYLMMQLSVMLHFFFFTSSHLISILDTGEKVAGFFYIRAEIL